MTGPAYVNGLMGTELCPSSIVVCFDNACCSLAEEIPRGPASERLVIFILNAFSSVKSSL